MTIEEAIKELCDWLEQMIQSGVPSHSAKRKTLAYAISALLDIDCMIAETEIHGLSRNWVNDLKKLIEPYSYTVPIKTDDKPIGEFDAITGTVTYYGKTRPSDITHTIYKEAEPSDTFVCPMCADCPDGCPLDKEKESTRPEPSDLISRADAVKAIKGHDERTKTDTLDDTDIGYSAGLDMAIEIVNKMPSVSAERVGVWIKGDDILDNTFIISCSVCGEGMYAHYNDEKYPNYCCNCGAKLKGCNNAEHL